MVVEQPRDLIALEQTGMYGGGYHVLLGRISPLEGIGPEDLTVGRVHVGSVAQEHDAAISGDVVLGIFTAVLVVDVSQGEREIDRLAAASGEARSRRAAAERRLRETDEALTEARVRLADEQARHRSLGEQAAAIERQRSSALQERESLQLRVIQCREDLASAEAVLRTVAGEAESARRVQADAARKLGEIAPGGLSRTLFTNSGTEAIETAIMLACLHTGRSEVVALRAGYHGRSLVATTLTAHSGWRPIAST